MLLQRERLLQRTRLRRATSAGSVSPISQPPSPIDTAPDQPSTLRRRAPRATNSERGASLGVGRDIARTDVRNGGDEGRAKQFSTAATLLLDPGRTGLTGRVRSLGAQ
jgi:hypothetical protein